MKQNLNRPVALAAPILALTLSLTASAGQQQYAASGPDSAALAAVIGQFRADIGGANNGAATNETVLATGRREINWDAAALPEEMPADFFNRVSKRGILFDSPGGSFRVSANSDSSADRLFGNVNPDYPNQFRTNSPNRLFSAWGSPITDVRFHLPGQPQIPATVSAFGAVFTDVEQANSTRIEAYDIHGSFMGSAFAPVAGNGGLSFAGIRFDAGERVGSIRIVSGNQVLDAQKNDEPGKDLVVMDDFIYSEPQNVGASTRIAFNQPGDLKPFVDAFRASLGANNGVSTNETVHAGGRREINWDAAALPVDMPADFFNSKSKRGAVFSTPGTGFRVSANTNAGPTRLFGDVNPDYVNHFATFSANRLFTAAGSTEVNVNFFVPGQPNVRATVEAFGAVFTDVDLEGPTVIEAYGLQQQLLASATAPASQNGGASFVALRAPAGERIATIRILSGSRVLAADAADDATGDVVVMDDFIYSEPQAAPAVFEAQGLDAAAIKGAVDALRAALGANNGVSTNDTVNTAGRREINWDAAALPVDMPADFFNATSKRGALFSTPGTGFQVSANSEDPAEARFANVNPVYSTHFTTNSPKRLFAAVNSTVVNTTFFVPGLPSVPAASSGFGVIFTGVNTAGSASIELFDAANLPLGTFRAPVSALGGLSFIGVALPEGRRAARVRITSGNLALGAANVDGNGSDVVAMDDFIYGEPIAQPLQVNLPIPQNGGKALVTLGGVAGIRYAVERSADFIQWTEVGTATTPAGVVDAEAANAAPAFFYRAVVK